MEAAGPEELPPGWADADDSSFSDTGSQWEDEPAVAPGGPSSQGGEGATLLGAPRVVFPPDAPGGGPSAQALPQPPVRDQAWRTYRRSLEWRCRWAELRLRELKAQEAHYAALEARLLARQAGGGSSGDAGAGGDGQTAGEAEAVAAADARDDRRWRRRLRRAAEAGAQPSTVACLDHLVAPLAVPPPPVVPVPGGDDGSDSDCGTARVFDSVAAVQQKVAHLYRQLSAYRTASGLPPAPPRRQHTVRLAAVVPSHHHANGNGRMGGGAGQGGGPSFTPSQAGPTLRRASEPGGGPQAMSRRERERGGGGMDFDINDVVGALGVATKVVERAAHVDIATPGVRKAQRAPWEGLSDARAAANALAAAQAAAEKAARAKAARKAAGGDAGADGSSSEDTSDEAYMALHAAMENQEKAWRLLPSLPGRGSGAVARGEKQAAATAAAAANGGAATLDVSSPLGEGDAPDEQALDGTTPTAAAAALLKGTPRAGACAAVAEWTITRGEGARRQHVLSLKRTELL